MNSTYENRLDEWVQDNLYSCPTCKYSKDVTLVCDICVDCDKWVERNWAEERKRIIKSNSERLKG